MRNLKKVIALVAVFALMLTTVTAFASSFVDVEDGASYTEAVEALNKLGIITGDTNDNGETQYRPADSVTRAEMAALVARIQGYDASSQQATSFTDVPSSHWASGYVAMAAQQGIVNGYGDGTFGPDDEVLYEQVIKMVMVTLGYEPFAAANGGYPTGYSIAASRYNVTDKVQGGVTGQAAPRSTIAQVLYNAIDTPLMQQYYYGTNNENYVIFDGTNGYDYRTLMSQYLKVTKLRGQLVNNGVTTLGGSATIDTSKDTEVVVNVNGNYNTSNTDYADIDADNTQEMTFLAGDSGVENYIGQQIVFYVKDDDTLSNPVVISAAPESGKNKAESFTLDKYDTLETTASGVTSIRYYKNDTDRNSVKLNIEDGAKVIYNGVGGQDLDAIFAVTEAETDKPVQKDSVVGGKVTLYDTNNVSGYDVVMVEVAATGVVESVEGNMIQFKESVGESTYNNNISNITVDADDNSQLIKLTKDGKDFDYSELKEWDVLSIITNTDLDEVYTIKVISNQVDGVVSTSTKSSTSWDPEGNDNGRKYRIGEGSYDVALNAYGAEDIQAGSAGLFYIDEYGKIAAYNRDGSTAEGVVNDNYAYIINSEEVSGITSGGQLQMLTAKEGIITNNLASTVTIVNYKDSSVAKDIFGETATGDYRYKVKDDESVGSTLEAMHGLIVKYNKNSANEISKLEFVSDKNTTRTSSLSLAASYTSATYDEDDKKISGTGGTRKFVDDSTIVFFVNGTDADVAEVGTIAEIADSEVYEEAEAYDENSAGYVRLLVVKGDNATSGISSSSSAVVIESVGTTTNTEGETVTTISYYQDGTLKNAYESENIKDDGYAIGSYNEGDMAVLSLNANGEIKSIKPLVVFDEDSVRDANAAGFPTGEVMAKNTDLVKVTEGVAVRKSGNRVTVYAPKKDGVNGGYELDDTYNFTGANVYVYDASKPRNNLTVGSVGNIVVTKSLLAGLISNPEKDPVDYEWDDATEAQDIVQKSTGDVVSTMPALDLCDYVYIRTYDDDVTDVLVIKAPDLGTLTYQDKD